ncbi:MAG: DUF1501 domain-containing protein [Paracoccus denitrificans]|uniref:DUF1501 domain-containing protein n=1 Tax=Paracoccus denitrificans TaxID=266 RepID=A0A533I5P7_PARDE|nr:MAG: DUF1501 domain-containing protein [Paracoccus denitrificans]
MDRRHFLNMALGAACSAAAMPLVTPMSFAATQGDKRFVAIVLRGAMDGLDVVQPYGDPLLRKLRKTISVGPEKGALDLDGFYALHPALAPLMPMWQAGELGFAQAVSTPYRDKRSHFVGQDILEAGTTGDSVPDDINSGWLNRLLPMLPGATMETAFAVGIENMTILSGDAAHASWAPQAKLSVTPQAQNLLHIMYENDPPFQNASDVAIALSAASRTGDAMKGSEKRQLAGSLASFAAGRLNADTRIAAFSLTGWDSHHRQQGSLMRALEQLAEALTVLKQELGANWGQTVVMAMTEFGRTVRENGTNGTDHGTGGLMIMAGGAIRGGRVYGDWPGLDEADLYAGRDLMPTADVRAYAGAALSGLFGVSTAAVESTIFPGLIMPDPPKLLL